MAQENAVTRYQRKVLVRRSFNLNRNTDSAIIEHLEKIDNVQGYIKSLIQADIKRLNAERPDADSLRSTSAL